MSDVFDRDAAREVRIEQIGVFQGWGFGEWGDQPLYGCTICGVALFNPDVHHHLEVSGDAGVRRV